MGGKTVTTFVIFGWVETVDKAAEVAQVLQLLEKKVMATAVAGELGGWWALSFIGRAGSCQGLRASEMFSSCVFHSSCWATCNRHVLLFLQLMSNLSTPLWCLHCAQMRAAQLTIVPWQYSQIFLHQLSWETASDGTC